MGVSCGRVRGFVRVVSGVSGPNVLAFSGPNVLTPGVSGPNVPNVPLCSGAVV